MLSHDNTIWSMVVKKKNAINLFLLQLFMFRIILQTFYTSHKKVLDLIFILHKIPIPYHKNYSHEVILKWNFICAISRSSSPNKCPKKYFSAFFVNGDIVTQKLDIFCLQDIVLKSCYGVGMHMNSSYYKLCCKPIPILSKIWLCSDINVDLWPWFWPEMDGLMLIM